MQYERKDIMSTEIDEKLEGIARAAEERGEMAAAELLGLSERLARLEALVGTPEREAQSARKQKRVLILEALTGDEEALREVERLEAVEEEARRRGERIRLAVEQGHERLRGLRGILRATSLERQALENGSLEAMLRDTEREEVPNARVV